MPTAVTGGTGSGLQTFWTGVADGVAAQSTNWPSVSDPGTSATNYFEMSFNTSGFTGISLEYDVFTGTTNASYPRVGVLVSYNGGNAWSVLQAGFNNGNNAWSRRSVAFLSSADNNSSLKVRFYGYYSNDTSNGQMRLDNITLYATGTTTTAGVKTLLNELDIYTGATSGGTDYVFIRTGAITFTGSGTTVVFGSNWAANGSVSVSNGATVSTGGAAGVRVLLDTAAFTLNSGATLEINSNYGITSGATAAGNIQSTGTRTFSSGANYVYNGVNAQVTGNGLPSTVNQLTINNAAGVTMSQAVTVSSVLGLTSGLLKVASYNVTLATGASVVGTPSASAMVVTDLDGSATGDGFLCKSYSGVGSFTFPVGDASGTAEYSPATVSFASGSFNAGNNSICTRVTDARHPNWPGASYPTYITRYWTVNNTNITGFTANAGFTYVDADVVLGGTQTEAALYHKIWNGSTWTTGNQTNTATNTFATSVTTFSDHTAFSGSPLAVTLSDFYAQQQGAAIELTWETNSELNNRGFNLYRGVSPAGYDHQLNSALIPSQAQGNPGGFVYTWMDNVDLTPGTTYYYWVSDVDFGGVETLHGPVSVDYIAPTAVTLNTVQADAAPLHVGALPWLWSVVGAAAVLALNLRRGRAKTKS